MQPDFGSGYSACMAYMDDHRPEPSPDPPLDAALDAYTRHRGRATPSPDLVPAIMAAVQVWRRRGAAGGMAELGEFARLAARDTALRRLLEATGDQARRLAALVEAGHARGFRFIAHDLSAWRRSRASAADGELDEAQLDAVAAAAAGDLEWLWRMLKDGP